MQRELHAVLFGDRHDPIEEPGEVVPELVSRDRAAPAGRGIEVGGVEGRHERAAPLRGDGRRAGPVVIGHEVVAEDLDAKPGHVADEIDEAGQLPLTALPAVREFVVRDVALDDREPEAVGLGLCDHVIERAADVRGIPRHDVAHAHLGGEAERGIDVRRADEGDAHG